ncbi:MAG: hypothetical protein L6R45_07020 [Anaerolineae bacterium]|nr:hypothetical protein [Anaerolineae bacterium]
MKKSFDVLILVILVIARVRIDTLADLVLPQRHEDVRRLVAGWWPATSLDRLAHPETDPVSLMLIVTAFGLLVVYGVVDSFEEERRAKTIYRLKLALIYGIIALLVFGKTILLINLRHLSGPASYAHDGGVIQTEATIAYFLQGLNPYVEDYVDTPMAEWGFDEYRTALYHYPYLPWTFIFSAPFYLLSRGLLGWFDERMVYLLLFALTLVLTQQLVGGRREKLIALALVGLNPILAVSVIFGENDPFVFFWIVLALWLVGSTSPGRRLAASAALGLAWASKPTAWFLAPFWLLYLLREGWGGRSWPERMVTLWRQAWPLPVVFGLCTLPWFVWNPEAMIDDVWRWSAGQGPTGYQIWGWGASNLVLALGGVADRFQYWPFIIPELLIGGPLLWFLLRRQLRHNTMGTMLYGYGILLLVFFFVSRFLQPNYLGYLAAVLTLAFLAEERRGGSET